MDDLTTQGATEPYRMFTSRAEFVYCVNSLRRLLFRSSWCTIILSSALNETLTSLKEMGRLLSLQQLIAVSNLRVPLSFFISRKHVHSRYRVSLRSDNADLRLTQKGFDAGVVGKDRYARFLASQSKVCFDDNIPVICSLNASFH